MPELQKSLSLFPDFEKEYSPKVEEVFLNDEDESVSDILMRISVEFQKLAKSYEYSTSNKERKTDKI